MFVFLFAASSVQAQYDRFETNDTFMTATPLGVMGSRTENAIINGGGTDYYFFQAAGSGTLNANIYFTHADGDLDLALYDGNQNPLKFSASSTDNESITQTLVAGSNYWLRVYGDINEYDFSFAGPSPDPDRFEANESMGAATDFGLMGDRVESNLSIHVASDQDFFRFRAGDDGTIDVRISFFQRNGDLDLRLLDGAGTVITSSVSTTDSEHLTYYYADKGSNYYIQVYGISAENVYDLYIDGPDIAPDRFEPNDWRTAQATDFGLLGDRVESNLNIHASGNPDYYRFHPASDGILNAEIRFSPSNGPLAVLLYNDSDTVLATSTSTPAGQAFSASVSTGTLYYVCVADQGGLLNEYDLVLDGPEYLPDRFEANNSRGTATDFGVFREQTESNLTLHGVADVDYYQFTAAGDGLFQAGVSFDHAAGNIDVTLMQGDGTEIAWGVSADDDEALSYTLIGGSNYYFAVYGVGGIDQAYDMTLLAPYAYPVDVYEANDFIEDAPDLGAMGDFFNASLSIHTPNNPDWYAFHMAGTGTLRIDLGFIHANGDLDMALYDGQSNLLTAASSSSNDELIITNAPSGTRFFLEVYGFSGAVNTYALSLDGPEFKPNLQSISRMAPNQLELKWSSRAGKSYRIEQSYGFRPQWQTYSSRVVAATAPVNIEVIVIQAAHTSMFYRVQEE